MRNVYHAPEVKIQIRELVYDFLKDCNTITTLPNLYFSLEKKLAKKSKVVCFERDKIIFKKQQKMCPPVELIQGNVLDYNPGVFDGLFLDFCGQMTLKFINYVDFIKPNSKLVATFLAAREDLSVQKFINPEDRFNSYIKLFKEKNFTINQFYKYQSTSPMLVLFLTKNQ